MPGRLALSASALAALAAAALAGCGGGSETSAPSEPFQPQASLRAVGGTARTDKPAFLVRVVARPGDANIRSVAVNLPPVVLIDATSIGAICSQRELKANRCAGHRRLGFAQVRSPAYDGSLSGPVYAVWAGGRLPDLAYVLGGPANILLRGRVVSTAGRIEAGVEDIPDTPVRSFQLRIDGGREGYLVLSRDICQGTPMADASFVSQEAQAYEERIPLRADCG